MRTPFLFAALVICLQGRAQLLHGSFEDDLGNYNDTGWVATCSTIPMGGAPGFGNWSILVPHSNAPGCGVSHLTQLVPAITDGSTWTLSGWCCNFTWFFIDPYIGFRFGIKRASGTLEYNTAAVTHASTWEHLSVTNSFSLAPGDTVFVQCDPGSVSGLVSNQVFAQFDGVELTSLTTGVEEVDEARIQLRPNPVVDRLWMATGEQPVEIRIINASGTIERSLPFAWRSGTVELDASDLAPGAHMVWMRTKEGVRTARFVKL